MKILFVQEAPCIRNYKMARALTGAGHLVDLAYIQAPLSKVYTRIKDDCYHESIQLRSYPHLWELMQGYDLVHCHNEPDVLTVVATAGDVPVVHDTHDIISLRATNTPDFPMLSLFEAVASRACDGRIYTTPGQRAEAERLYGATSPALVHYNYVSEGDLPTEALPKLSQRDGKVHIVYEGGIGPGGHRDFFDLFSDLASRGVVVHIYPAQYNWNVCNQYNSVPGIQHHEPVSPHEIMTVMTQYDFGIIPFNMELGNKRFLNSSMANKLFEYLAAGLPVFASPLKSYKDYFTEHPVGRVFNDAEHLVQQLDDMRRAADDISFNEYVLTHEQQVPALERFYEAVIYGSY